jgi:hypothetical protein
MKQPVFTRLPEEYKRDIDVIQHSIADAAFFLHKHTGDPIEQCREFVLRQVKPGGALAINDPETLVLERQENGDKIQKVMPISQYLRDITDTGNIVAPTFTVYTNPAVEVSLLSKMISGNIQKRAAAKKKEHAAMMEGDKVKEAFHNIEQTCAKLDNNGLSGAHASPSTILRNKSSHSTLTSTCRSVTSYGNMNNEKFIGGRRHYWSADIVIANITSICRHTNLVELQAVIDRFGIYIPTTDDVMECINHSVRSYWMDKDKMQEVIAYVNVLLPIERAAFVYVADLYHLAKHNDKIVRDLVGSLAYRANDADVVAMGPEFNPDTYIMELDTDQAILVSLVCAKDLNGGSIKKCKEKDYAAYCRIATTSAKLFAILENFRDLIKALWVTDNMPASIAHVQSVVREVVVGGDTDSTLFTVQWWTKWYVGQYDFSDLSKAIAAAITYLTSQSVAHILAMCSANMGIPAHYIHRISMKNEFYFPVFIMTMRAKHYIAYQGAKEGNVFEHNELEIKGVALRNSNVPANITKYFRKVTCELMDRIIADVEIDPYWLLDLVYDQERSILDAVESGSTRFLKSGQIKEASNYANPRDSKILSYDMWQKVFGPKYGLCDEPPYEFVKVNLHLNNKTMFNKWLNSLEDVELAHRLRTWMTDNGKDIIKTMYLPEHIVGSIGVPQEIVKGINKRQLVFETLESFYLLLEAMGLFMINDNLTVLVTDYYTRSDRPCIAHVA